MDKFGYTDPVAQLLTFNSRMGGYEHQNWFDYVSKFDLTTDDVPELIRMAHDLDTFWSLPEGNSAGYAPLHAIRALGQLRDPRAIEPLLDLLAINFAKWDSDFLAEDLPQAIGLMGEAALQPISAFLNNSKNDDWAKQFLSASFEVIAADQPTLRDNCIELTAESLSNFKQQTPELNASLVIVLVKMNAVAQAPLIQQAFEADCVDEMFMGDWEDVQVQLGLLEKRVTPKRNYYLEQMEAAKTAAEKQRAVKEKRTHRQHIAKQKKAKRNKKKKRKR